MKFTSLVFLLTCLFLHHFAFAQYQTQTAKSARDYFNGIDFTYDHLVDLIRTKNIKSLDELLPQLPTSLRSNFTLMHSSLSLQEATPLKPRVIMFQPDGKLSCTFIDNEGAKGHDALECYQFRDQTKTFDFREIQFPTAQNGLQEVVFSRSNMSANGKISCTNCHGVNPRPNWEGYNFWAGAYGAHDDVIDISTKEGKNFLAFRKAANKSKRYSQLLYWGTDDKSEYLNQNVYPYSLKRGYDEMFRPNLRYNGLVLLLMAERNARMIENKGVDNVVEFLWNMNCAMPSDIPSEALIKKQREYLSSIYKVFDWTPYFRSHLNDCNGCEKNNPDTVLDIDLSPLSFDYTEGSDGIRMNYFVSQILIGQLARKSFFSEGWMNISTVTQLNSTPSSGPIEAALIKDLDFLASYNKVMSTRFEIRKGLLGPNSYCPQLKSHLDRIKR